MSLRQHLTSLGARFDGLALQAPAAGAAETALQRQAAAPWTALQAWCWLGAGPGNSIWWQPGARPAVGTRLAVAALQGPDAAATTAWAEAFACQLDGSTRLAAKPGRAAGLALRLGVKARDAMWWRARQPCDPWDAGWALHSPPALRHWRDHFVPRRATLILADGHQAHTLQGCLATLLMRCDEWRHPVRWLWVGGDGDMAPIAGLPMARFGLA